jgi:hypothetical protein
MGIQSLEEIRNRIVSIEDRLKLIDDGINKEMSRPFLERREHLCLFLDVEKKIYLAKLDELKWIIDA